MQRLLMVLIWHGLASTPRFDLSELTMINSRIIGQMEYTDVLEKRGSWCDGQRAFGVPCRDIQNIAETKHWFDVATQPITSYRG